MGMRLIPNGERAGNGAEGAYRAARQQHDGQDRLEQARDASLRLLRETGHGWDAYRASVAPTVSLHTKVRSRTGALTSTFASNDGVHHYEGVVLGMRQQILAECAASGLVLPSRFEFASPHTVMTIFWGMHTRGYFA